MRQSDLDALAAAQKHRRKIFVTIWFVIGPIMIIILCVLFAGPKPTRSAPPPVYSCQNVQKTIDVLGDGGSIAPLCGQTPDPAYP